MMVERARNGAPTPSAAMTKGAREEDAREVARGPAGDVDRANERWKDELCMTDSLW
jgi:hypothetical protein